MSNPNEDAVEKKVELTPLGAILAEMQADFAALAERVEYLERGPLLSDVERRGFIRETAIHAYVRGMRGAAEMYTPQQCWAMGVALWEAKPEGC